MGQKLVHVGTGRGIVSGELLFLVPGKTLDVDLEAARFIRLISDPIPVGEQPVSS
jgi:hypothetical protein